MTCQSTVSSQSRSTLTARPRARAGAAEVTRPHARTRPTQPHAQPSHEMDPDFDPRLPVTPASARLARRPTRGAQGQGWLGTGPGRTNNTNPGVEAPPFELAVLAGGCASAAVDVCIYPLDTLKTRMQAAQGFRAAGGYTGLFSGVTAAALGAVPGGALFFGVPIQ